MSAAISVTRLVRAGHAIPLFMLAVACSLCFMSLARSAAPLPEAEARKYAVNPVDGAELVWIPAGPFRMGTSDEEIATMLKERKDYKASMFTDERPQHEVTLDGYWVYTCEVTVTQYRVFCKATKRAMPDLPAWSTDAHPIVGVTWDDAVAYARWANADLPTEAQWEKAARGTECRIFPWGNTWDVTRCNNFSNTSPLAKNAKSKQTAPVGSFLTGDSPYGVHDMAGNVWEWCRDWYAEDYYTQAAKANPLGPEHGEQRVMRGGSWGSTSRTSRTTARLAQSPEDAMHDCGGFRCVVTTGKVVEKKTGNRGLT